jgi:ABC-type branched-subunit amino acid transport system ATPase component
MLELKNIYAGYTEGNPILKGINLTLNEGEVVGIIGQNGSGKSTLAKTIMNLVPYITGECIYDGRLLLSKEINNSTNPTNEITKMGIGFFLQGGRIFPHLTVKENISFALRNSKRKGVNKTIPRLKEYLDVMNNRRENLQASYLSGGEQHQLALAMVLVNNPKMLILDEPSAGLSPINTKAIYEAVNIFKKDNHATILLIEQNLTMAFENCDRISLLENGIIKLEGNTTKEFKVRVMKNLFQ